MRWMISITTTILLLAANGLAQGQSAPIVKQVALANQTSFIKPTVLVTPKNNALYRVSAYLEATAIGTNGDEYYLNIGWMDAMGKKQKIAIQIFDSEGQDFPLWGQTTLVVSDLAGNPLGYSVTDVIGGQPQVPYSVFITVEQLQ